MKVMAEGIGGRAHAIEVELASLLAPECLSASVYEVTHIHAVAIGNLAAMLVTKGICTVREAQEACGVGHYKVVGRPVTQR